MIDAFKNIDLVQGKIVGSSSELENIILTVLTEAENSIFK